MSRYRYILLLFALPFAAFAQTFPTKPIRMVVPYPPGGAADLVGRLLCEKFPQGLGQPCVVENKPGAGGLIGIDQVAKAEPDGHTLVIAPSNLSIIPTLYPKVPYDTLVDLAPVALVVGTPIMIGVHPGVAAKTYPELVRAAREADGKMNFTSCGPASPQHLAGEMLAAIGTFRWTHIPYKGCGPAMTDTLAGVVPVIISTTAHFNPQIKAGRLRGIAVLGADRTQFAPDYPTIAQSGFPGFQMDVWFGLLTTGKTPAPALARLNAELNRALSLPDLREKLIAGAYEPLGGTPERFAEVIRTDLARFGKVIREQGIRAE